MAYTGTEARVKKKKKTPREENCRGTPHPHFFLVIISPPIPTTTLHQHHVRSDDMDRPPNPVAKSGGI